MKIPVYQIDAFTRQAFSGNPAAVCPLESWLTDDTMQAVALENNLSETAFFVPDGDGYHIRWFTPTVEVDLCGHATLASAFLVLNRLTPDAADWCSIFPCSRRRRRQCRRDLRTPWARKRRRSCWQTGGPLLSSTGRSRYAI
jgi:hypothetical protein